MRPLEYSQSQTCRGSAPWTMTPEQKALLDGYIAAEGLLRPKPKSLVISSFPRGLSKPVLPLSHNDDDSVINVAEMHPPPSPPWAAVP